MSIVTPFTHLGLLDLLFRHLQVWQIRFREIPGSSSSSSRASRTTRHQRSINAPKTATSNMTPVAAARAATLHFTAMIALFEFVRCPPGAPPINECAAQGSVLLRAQSCSGHRAAQGSELLRAQSCSGLSAAQGSQLLSAQSCSGLSAAQGSELLRAQCCSSRSTIHLVSRHSSQLFPGKDQRRQSCPSRALPPPQPPTPPTCSPPSPPWFSCWWFPAAPRPTDGSPEPPQPPGLPPAEPPEHGSRHHHSSTVCLIQQSTPVRCDS
jgi:hypothetical protein